MVGAVQVQGNAKHVFPYYRQMTIGTCGPACVMMVLSHFDPAFSSNRWLELKYWSNVWLFPLGATDAYGLAALLASRGLRVMIIREGNIWEFKARSRAVNMFVRLFGVLIRLLSSRNRVRAMDYGVQERYGRIDVELIRGLLGEGYVAIAQVDQTAYCPDRDFPYGVLHWVAVFGANDLFHIHDPDLGAIQLSAKELQHAMDVRRNFGIARNMVVARAR